MTTPPTSTPDDFLTLDAPQHPPPLTPAQMLNALDLSEIEQELAERSLYEFVRQAWPTIEPGVVFVDNWHVKAICDHLQAITDGVITRLIINIPPRHMKSTIVSVCWPVWSWIRTPHRKFLFASYAQALSTRDAVKSRRLLNSDWFKKRWDDTFMLSGDQNQKQRYENDHTGYRIATSVDGGLTGEGGDIICFPAETPVQTENGLRPIHTVKPGTRVWSFNRVSHKHELKPVSQANHNGASKLVRVILSDGSTFRCTPDHKILTTSGYIPAALLQPFHRIVHRSTVFNMTPNLPDILCEKRPALSTTDILNLRFGNIPFEGDNLSGANVRCDIPDLILFKLCLAVEATDAVFHHIQDVFRATTSLQIAKAVIRFGSIKMAHFLARFARGKERSRHFLMNRSSVASPVYTSVESGVRIPSTLQNSATEQVDIITTFNKFIKGSYSPQITNLVTGTSNNLFPLLVIPAGHVPDTYCLSVSDNRNFSILGNTMLVSNCIDDPHNVREAESEKTRQGVTEWWDQALPSRLNDPKTGAFVVIMQRVHEKDLAGHILKNDQIKKEWDILCFPARYEALHPTPTESSLGFVDPRTEEGELLWPDRFDEPALKRLEHSLGEYGSAGQLQQRPAPKGGGILRRKWWRQWEKKTFPSFVYVLQSWDTAYTEKKTGSYSACTTWGVFRFGSSYHIMIMARFRDHMAYPELRKKARELYDEFAPDAVLVEKKASGQSLVQDLKQMGIPILTYQPDRDKIARAHSASALLESGIVWYPDRKWAESVIHHCAVFPAGDGADIVDTVTQALIRLRQMWYAEPPQDQGWDPRQEERHDEEDEDSNVIQLQGPIYG